MAGTFTITGLTTGLPVGEEVFGPVTITGAATIGQVTDVTLSAGDNTLSVPAGATAVVLVLPSANSSQLKLRSNLNSADAGTPFGPTGVVLWPLFAGTTSLIINAAGSSGLLEAKFI